MHRIYTSVRNIHLTPVGARARLFTQSINLPPVVVNNDAFIQEALSSFTHSILTRHRSRILPLECNTVPSLPFSPNEDLLILQQHVGQLQNVYVVQQLNI